MRVIHAATRGRFSAGGGESTLTAGLVPVRRRDAIGSGALDARFGPIPREPHAQRVPSSEAQ